MLSPALNPQVDGSAAPVAIPVFQVVTVPLDTDTVEPQGVMPLVLLR